MESFFLQFGNILGNCTIGTYLVIVNEQMSSRTDLLISNVFHFVS